MEELQVGPFEAVIEGSLLGIWAVTEDQEGTIFAACQTGHIHTIIDRQCQELYNTGGQPTSLVFESANKAYIADMAHQRIFCYTEDQGHVDVTEIVKDYERKPLLGPNCLALNRNNNYLYFTDSGPLGETSIVNPAGSLFAADLDLMIVKPIALKCLAHPSGIAITPNGATIYVAETGLNRILRIVRGPNGAHHLSVFYQFTSRLGPSAIAISENGFIYVASYDFSECSQNGLVSILNNEGVFVNSFTVPSAPEITSLYFSSAKPNVLYITEATNSTCYKVAIPTDHI